MHNAPPAADLQTEAATVDRIRFAVSPHLAFERPQMAVAWLGAIERSDGVADGCTTRF